MPEVGSPRFRARTLKDPFSLRAKRTDVGREVLAGIMGWMTVVSSVAFCEFGNVVQYGDVDCCVGQPACIDAQRDVMYVVHTVVAVRSQHQHAPTDQRD